jgi:hypothetical protein
VVPGTHHVEKLDEDMPGQPSLPLPQPLVDERSWCDDHGILRADNDKLIDSATLAGGVKVVRPRFAAGAPPGPLRTRRRACSSAVESWAVPAQRKRSLLRPLTRPRSFRHAWLRLLGRRFGPFVALRSPDGVALYVPAVGSS